MKRTTETTHRYECEICGYEHRTQDEALRCEDAGIPDRRFQVGDKVIAAEQRLCKQYPSSPSSLFTPRGEVVEIQGPYYISAELLSDIASNLPENIGSHIHVWLYTIRFTCSHCADERQETLNEYQLAKK